MSTRHEANPPLWPLNTSTSPQPLANCQRIVYLFNKTAFEWDGMCYRLWSKMTINDRNCEKHFLWSQINSLSGLWSPPLFLRLKSNQCKAHVAIARSHDTKHLHRRCVDGGRTQFAVNGRMYIIICGFLLIVIARPHIIYGMDGEYSS